MGMKKSCSRRTLKETLLIFLYDPPSVEGKSITFPVLMGDVLLTPEAHLQPQVIKFDHHQVLNPCKNRYLHVFIGDVLLTRHKRTDRKTNPFNFFRTTLPSVEGIIGKN